MSIFLYILLIFAWGASWIAISWQQSDIAPIVSIFYRFALAVILLFPTCLLLKKIEKTKMKDHIFFYLQGSFLFCFNFICFYYASHWIVSGLIAVIFSSAMFFNMINGYLIYRIIPRRNEIIGGLVGILGIIFVFYSEISLSQADEYMVYGIILSILGVFSFSLGNMVSLRNSRAGISQLTTNNYALSYGSLNLFIICIILDARFDVSLTFQYIASWLFLSIAATIFGFVAYLKLVAEMGASKAAYILIITPIVALSLSAMFEDYTFQTSSLIGMLLVSVGAFFTNRK